MGLKSITIEVPEVSSLLLDTVVEVVKDAKDKKWSEIAEDLFKVVRQYDSLGQIKEEVKTPEIALAGALCLGQLVMAFLPKKAVQVVAEAAADALPESSEEQA